MAAEHTCERRARRGRPHARPPRRWPRARPPADTVFPRSRSITHTRRPGLRREGTRGEGGINWERAKGQTPHPRPRARTGGNRNVTQGEPSGSKVHGRACSLDAEEAPSPRSGRRGREARSPAIAGRSGDQVARPSPGVCAPGRARRGSLSAWISIPPGSCQDSPSRSAERAPAQSTGCRLFVRTPRAAPAQGQRPEGEP